MIDTRGCIFIVKLKMEAPKIELSISCTNLPRLDRFSKSDPMCVLYQSNERGGRRYWDQEDQTEAIKDCSDPTVRS